MGRSWRSNSSTNLQRDLDNYHLLHAARADLLRRKGSFVGCGCRI